MKIVVTGGAGSPDRGIGPVIVNALEQAGHDVVILDIRTPPPGDRRFRHLDLSHYGDTFAALHGAEAVVHLAANANPDFDHFTGAQRFHTNTLAAYNVFQSAVTYGIKRVVWASSETVLGYPFDKVVPPVLPLDDDAPPIPTASYGISKAITEDLARHLSRMNPGTSFVGLRFSNIHYDTPGHPTGYDTLPAAWADPASKKFNLWAYIDSRDVAQAVQKALTADVTGAEAVTIAAADTLMKQPNEELLRHVPGTSLKPGTGPYETLISIDKARQLIGYEPEWSWRRVLGEA